MKERLFRYGERVVQLYYPFMAGQVIKIKFFGPNKTDRRLLIHFGGGNAKWIFPCELKLDILAEMAR